jgi:hypothetical protein
VKVPYVEDKTTRGGFSSPSEEELAGMIRTTVDTWTPRRGPDWPDILIRLASGGPPPWLIYTAASAALVVILIAAFIVGSALQLGALAPQPIQVHIGGK